MSEMIPNFSSVVVVGAFNPTILTKNFVQSECDLKVDSDKEPANTPIMSQLEASGMSILAELDKLQVVIKEYDTKQIEFMCQFVLRYLAVLAYTPISALGINFNYTLSGIDGKTLTYRFHEYLRDYFLGGRKEIELASNLKYFTPEKALFRGGEVRCSLNDDVQMRVNVNNLGSNLILNFNYELPNLRENRDKVKSLPALLPTILKSRTTLVGDLFNKYEV